jgi:hypothetical protein
MVNVRIIINVISQWIQENQRKNGREVLEPDT